MSSTLVKKSQDGNWNGTAAAELDRYTVVYRDGNGKLAYPTAASQRPSGVIPNGCDAADDSLDEELLGKGETKIVTASATVAIGDEIVAAVDGSGEAKPLPTDGGIYYVIGRALTAASAGDAFALLDHEPIRKSASGASGGWLGVVAADPDAEDLAEGDMWYNSTDNALKLYSDSAVVVVQAAA